MKSEPVEMQDSKRKNDGSQRYHLFSHHQQQWLQQNLLAVSTDFSYISPDIHIMLHINKLLEENKPAESIKNSIAKEWPNVDEITQDIINDYLSKKLELRAQNENENQNPKPV